MKLKAIFDIEYQHLSENETIYKDDDFELIEIKTKHNPEGIINNSSFCSTFTLKYKKYKQLELPIDLFQFFEKIND